MLTQQTAQTTTQNELLKTWIPKRGEIYLANLGDDGIGSEQRGIRPVVIISNNKGNMYSGILQIAPITSKKKNNLPTHVTLNINDGLRMESIISVEQSKCISKRRVMINGSIVKISQLSNRKMQEVDIAIQIQFGLI